MSIKKVVILDEGISTGIVELIKAGIPAGWTLAEDVRGARVLVTMNKDIPEGTLREAGNHLDLIIKFIPGKAAVAATSARIVEIGEPAKMGVAEHAVTLILALSRHLLYVVQQTNAKKWVPGCDQPALTDQDQYAYNWIGLLDFGMLFRKTVGLVGFGYIGKEVARRLKPFGVRILYNDINRCTAETEAEYGVEYRDLDSLLQESDFVSLHLVYTGDNDKLFRARQFGLMKPSAYFINTSRGRMVDEEALVEALKSKRIAGTALDVFYYEPFHNDHPLLSLAGANVILTPHLAGTPDAQAWQIVADQVIELLNQYS